MRCALRYQDEGSFPKLIGFPFAILDIVGDDLEFRAGRGAPFDRPRWKINRSQITKLERTVRGVRFYATGINDPWSIASLFPKYFLRKLAENGIVAEGPIIATTWNTV